jgi:hypothetical protein
MCALAPVSRVFFQGLAPLSRCDGDGIDAFKAAFSRARTNKKQPGPVARWNPKTPLPRSCFCGRHRGPYPEIVNHIRRRANMEGNKVLGLAVAASAAALFITGCANMGSGAHSGNEAKMACNGGNACKGQSECKSANSSCKGQNACKGQGFVSLTPEECKKATDRS